MNFLPKKLRPLLSRLPRVRGAGPFLLPLFFLVVFLAGWWIARPAEKAARSTDSTESDTIWTCSMHPTVRQPEPGLCPICKMDLIKVSAHGAGGLRELTLSNDAIARLDVRVAPVVRQPAVQQLQFLGRVAPDETRVTTTTARMDGRLDQLFIDYTGISVRKGDHVAEIYSPDLYIAQEELIQARRRLTASPGDRTRETLHRAAREKLRLLGIGPARIDSIEGQAEPSDHLTLNAPQDGIVLKLHKREGDYVKTGEAIYSLADLSQVWVFLEAYEDDLPWLRFAQEVTFRADALPGRTFTGKIALIDPILDENRRIARIRVNVPNPDRVLKPGLFVRGKVRSMLVGDRVLRPDLAGKWISPMHPEIIKDQPGKCDICGMDLLPAEELGFDTSSETQEPPLLIPASAVLRTGDRAVVYRRIESETGIAFEGREIVLGPRAGEFFVVESGVRAGDLVVTRGAFKLDSELQIRARPAMMLEGQGIEERSALKTPKTVSGAWEPVLRTLARARRDLAQPEEFLAHLRRTREVVAAIQPDFLPDDYAPLWGEASMKLENLFAAAHRDAKKSSPAQAWEKLARELPESAALAGLSWQLPELRTLPDEQLAEMRAVIDAYLPVADHLAHDKPQEALAAKESLAAALQKVSLEKVAATAEALAAAPDENALRAALKTVTAALEPVIREFGDDQLGPLYLVHCPMAFKNAGADWLSRQAVVENPYYGSRMFSCGDVTATLSLPAVTTKASEDHSKHKR